MFAFILLKRLQTHVCVYVQAHVDESAESSADKDEEEEEHESPSNADQKDSYQEEVMFSTGAEDEDDKCNPNWASLEEDSTSDKDDDEKKTKVRQE